MDNDKRKHWWWLWACFAVALAVPCTAPSTADGDEPHAWLATAPGELVRFIDSGGVEIAVDDDRIRQAGKTALTVFQFKVDNDFRFRQHPLPQRNVKEEWQVKINAWMDQPKLKLSHRILIQSTFNPPMPWQSRLLLHEFDHVAISTDPRLLKIIKRLLAQRRQWTAKWVQPLPPSVSEVRERIEATFRGDVMRLDRLVQLQYDWLDSESANGQKEVGDRKEFFLGLYTLDGLDRCKFEMDETMREFVKQRISTPASLKEIEAHYRFR